MRKLTMFNFISLNGCYKDINNDISWHKQGQEEEEYSAESLRSGNILLFGRTTYQMMAGWWPSPMAIQYSPEVAKGMNDAEKIVFSRTLDAADWNNTRIISHNIIDTIKKMKQQPGNDMTILGSGSIVTQFTEEGLIDEYQLMIDPVAITGGTPVFNKLQNPLNLELSHTRIFQSGTILLSYKPA